MPGDGGDKNKLGEERAARTVLSHAAEMDLEASVVLDKGLVPVSVFCDPIADVCSEVQVAVGGAVELVGEGTEEAVAITDGISGVEAEGA